MPAARFDAYKTLAFSGISSTFATIGTAWTHAMRIFVLLNNTDQDMIFSVDATNNNFYLPAGSFQLFDLTANTDVTTTTNMLGQSGTQWYVKQGTATAATKGAVYVEGIYAAGQ